MTTTYDTDPDTATVAAAWSSSPIGQPEGEARYGFPDEPATESGAPRSTAKHAFLAIALAGGIAAGAALGLMFIDTAPDQPTVAIPRSASPQPAVVVTPGVPAPTQAGIETAPATAPHVNTAPVVTTVVDVPTPSNPAPAGEPEANEPQPPEPGIVEPPKPEDPEPPKPLPPGPGDLKLPEPPQPAPPVFDPDLPLAPFPQPKPPTPSDFVPSLGLGS